MKKQLPTNIQQKVPHIEKKRVKKREVKVEVEAVEVEKVFVTIVQ